MLTKFNAADDIPDNSLYNFFWYTLPKEFFFCITLESNFEN